MLKRLTLALLAAFCITTIQAQVILTNHGKGKAAIVLTEETATNRTAATLLQDFVARMSGVTLPICTNTKLKNRVVIGEFEHSTEVGEDGYRLRTEGNSLHIIAGGDKVSSQGAIYGVVALLEDVFGVNYWSKDYCTFDKKETLVVPSLNVFSTPAFRYRQTQSYGCEDPIYKLWYALDEPKEVFIDNLWVHTFNHLLPSEVYGKAHPEYYAFFNGERHPGRHSQWCLTNPEVLEIVCQRLDSIFKANPDKKLISVSQNDGNNTYCQCPECAAITAEEGAVSGGYIRFLNKLARRFPDKEFSTLAYLFTMQPPRITKPEPNVNIMLCDIDCKREVPLTDNASGQDFVRAIEGWSKISNNIFVWDYGINFDNTVSPFPNFHILQPNIKLFHQNHATMHFSQVNGICGGDFSELRAYMIAKLMWNPYADADSLMQKFLKGFYGAAAPYIYEYLKLQKGGLLASHTELWIYDSPISHKNGMLCPALLKEYDRLFDLAEKAVANDATRLDNVRRSRLTLQYSELEIARTQPDGDKSAVERLLDLFEQHTTKYGVKTLNERHNHPADYCKLYRTRFLPAAEKSKALGAKVEFTNTPGERYQPIAFNGALTDGLYGGTTYVESWVGWCGEDADFIIDLGEAKTFSRIESDFLHQLGAWILLPRGGSYYTSDDKQDWKSFGTFAFEEDRDVQVKFVPGIAETTTPVTARYIRVKVNTLGQCPDWHFGVGYPAWFFLDEVSVY